METNVSGSRAFLSTLRPIATAPFFCLARAIHGETTCSESPFTQAIRIALAAFCKCYNSGGNDRFHGLIRAPEAVNVFYCPVVSVGHHLNVHLFKYRIADKWNNRGHGFPTFAISLKDFPHSGGSLFKIDHIWGRLMSAHAVKSGHYKSEAPRPLTAQSDD